MAELVAGIGLRPGTAAEWIVRAVREVAGGRPIGVLATVDRRAVEPGVRAAATTLGAALLAFTPAELDAVTVPHPVARIRAVLGTASVAEAAALLAAGAGARLVTPKTTARGVTVALAAMP